MEPKDRTTTAEPAAPSRDAPPAEAPSPAAPPVSKTRKRGKWPRRLATWLVVLALLAFAAATFPRHWGPRLVERVIHWIPPFGDASVTALHIDCISPTLFRATGIRLGGFPAEPSCEEVVVRYSLRGLLWKKVDSVEVKGLSASPAYQPEFAYFFGQKSKLVPATKSPTGKGGTFDPLQGWGVGSLRATTKDIDFSPVIPPEAQGLFTNLTARAELTIEQKYDRWHDRWPGSCSYHGQLEGGCLGLPLKGHFIYTPSCGAGHLTLSCTPTLALAHIPLPPSIRASASFAFSDTNGVGVAADGHVAVANTPWRLDLQAHADPDGVALQAILPETSVDENDGLVAGGLAFVRPMLEQANISNGFVRLHGTLSSTNHVTIIPGRQPIWETRLILRDVGGSATVGKFPCFVEGGKTHFHCTGIGPKWDMHLFFVSFTNAAAGPFPIDGGRGSFLLNERDFVMTKGSVDFCGGTISLYALYFNFARQNTGFTLYLDNLEVNRLLGLIPNIEGTASGQLFGKLPLHIFDAGDKIRISDGFLYNRPGERGFIRIPDPSPLTDWMEGNGVPADISSQIGFALKDLKYHTIRLDLTAPRDADGHIGIMLEGMAGESEIKGKGKVKGVPVDLNINVNGPLERILNFNLKLKKML